MKPLRVAILTPTFLPKCAGAEVFHHNFASRLAQQGHSPVVIAPRGFVRRLRESGWELPYEVEPLQTRIWNWLGKGVPGALWLSRRALSRLQREQRFDVWHAVVLFPAGVCLADWQSRSGVPGLVRAVGDDVSGLPGEGHAKRVAELLRSRMPLAQAVVALSESMVLELGSLGIDRGRIHVIPNAVDAGRFAPGPDKPALRAARGWGVDDFVFLCVARNHPQKDFPTLFRAFRSLLEKNPRARLAVAGRGVPSLRAELGDISARVDLFEFGAPAARGAVPPMPSQELVDLYRAADAFVMTSLLEGFSSALVEAMASALPVIASDAPGIREVARGRGLLIPCGDADAFASAMGEVASSAGLRGELSAQSLVAARDYSWPAVTGRYVSLYRELMAQATHRPRRVARRVLSSGP